MDIYIGCHLSVTRGYEAMGKTMLAFGGSTFAWFTRNPRGGKTKDVAAEDAAALNLDMLEKDLLRMEQLPGNYYNFHPGAHVGQGAETGIQLIADALNRFFTPAMQTTVLLETMAGKGSEVGGRFEELREIIDRTELSDRLGVCLDTCHVWDAGYDLVHDLDGVLEEFDRVIGLERLKAIHFNDSKNDCGSHKDRHEKLGQGRLGMEAMRRIARHPALAGLPFILETPNDEAGYRAEIRTVRSWFES